MNFGRKDALGRKSYGRDMERLRVDISSAAVPGGKTDHGGLLGLADDDHPQYGALAQAESVVGQWGFNPASAQAPFTLNANAQGQLVTGLRADELNKSISSSGLGLSGGGVLTASQTITLASSAAPGAAASILATTAAGLLTLQKFAVTDVDSDLIPGTGDAYDLGSTTKLWRHGYLSELDAIIFAENVVSILGGWLIVGHDQGTLVADVDSLDTTVDFGKTMTVSDFVLFRAALKVEYMTVGTLVSGTTYNVTRDVDGSGANDWPAGTPFLVLGQTGDPRIELVANGSDVPKISILEQGATYSTFTERVRIGNMRSSYGAGATDRYGIGIGDYSGGNYLSYNAETAGVFTLKAGDAGVVLDDTGITIVSPVSMIRAAYVQWETVAAAFSARIGSDNVGNMSVHANAQVALDVGAEGSPSAKLTALASPAMVVVGNGGLKVGSTSENPGTGHLYVLTDERIGGGLYVGATNVDPSAGEITATNMLWVNESANTFMTQGLTINQGSNDDEILALKSLGDVGHPMTDLAEGDTYGTFKKREPLYGGLEIAGYTDAGGTNVDEALGLIGRTGESSWNTLRSTAARGVVTTFSQKTDGSAGVTGMGTNENLFVVCNSGNATFLVDAEGDIHYDGTNNPGAWDKYDDVGLLTGLRASLAAPGHEMRERFADWIEYARPVLEKTGVVTYNEDGHHFVSHKAFQMLQVDAIRQLYDRIRVLENKIFELQVER